MKPLQAQETEIQPIEKTNDSYIRSHYEGSERVERRLNTSAQAKVLAKGIARRLNRDCARAEFMLERDLRIYVLAKIGQP